MTTHTDTLNSDFDENVTALVEIVEEMDEMTPDRGYFDWYSYNATYIENTFNFASKNDGLSVHVEFSTIPSTVTNRYGPREVVMGVISKFNDNCKYSEAEIATANDRLKALHS